MNAVSLYVTTSRMILQSINVNDAGKWADINRLVVFLRQSLTCCVCGRLLVIPMTSTISSCQHHVCKACLGGRMKLKPSCSFCKDHSKFCENTQLRVLLQCYKKLCKYINSTSIPNKWGSMTVNCPSGSAAQSAATATASHGVGSLIAGPTNFYQLIEEGANLDDNFVFSASQNPIAGSMFRQVATIDARKLPPKVIPPTPASGVGAPKISKPVATSTIPQVPRPQAEPAKVQPSPMSVAAPPIQKTIVTQKVVVKKNEVPSIVTQVKVGDNHQTAQNIVASVKMSTQPLIVTQGQRVQPEQTKPIVSTANIVKKESPQVFNNQLIQPVQHPKVLPAPSTPVTVSLTPNLSTTPVVLQAKAPSGTGCLSLTPVTPSVANSPVSSLKSKNKRRGCRCGLATPNPGKLTCCGQRCPCYVDGKGCFDCKCRGCRNPHRANTNSGIPVTPAVKPSQTPSTPKALPVGSVAVSSGSGAFIQNCQLVSIPIDLPVSTRTVTLTGNAIGSSTSGIQNTVFLSSNLTFTSKTITSPTTTIQQAGTVGTSSGPSFCLVPASSGVSSQHDPITLPFLENATEENEMSSYPIVIRNDQ